jgi:hypothetical protein
VSDPINRDWPDVLQAGMSDVLARSRREAFEEVIRDAVGPTLAFYLKRGADPGLVSDFAVTIEKRIRDL